MASLLKPFQVLSPRRQVPVGKLAIDWTHPLTNGLMGCWVPGVSEGLDLTGNFPTLTSTAVTSGPLSGTSAEGPTFGDAFTNKYGNLRGTAPPRFKNATQVSVYWRGVLGPVLPSVYVYLVYCAYDTGVNSPYDVWAMGDISFNSMGSVGLGWNSGGNEVKSPSTISLTGAHRQISLLGTTKVGGNATLYSNGQQAFQNTFAPSLPASSATSEFNISGWAGANRQAGVGTSVTYVWDRELSAAEAAQIDADPYTFLIPAYQESLPVITAATAGGTTQHMAANATGVATATGTLAAGITVAARWNPSDVNANAVLTNSNTTLSTSTGTGISRSAQFESSGQKYFEIVCGGTGIRATIGLANSSESISNAPGFATGSNSIGYFTLNGDIRLNNVTVATGSAASLGDIIGFYVDFGMGKCWIYKNNVQTGSTGTPGVSGGLTLPSGALAIMDAVTGTTNLDSINATTTYTPLTGFTGFGNGLATSDHMAANATVVATASGAPIIHFHLAAGATSTATAVGQLGGGTDDLAANAASVATATANARLTMHLSAAGTSLAAAQAGLSVTHNLAAAAISIASASAALFDQPQDHLAAAASSIATALAGVEVKHHMAAAAASLATMAGTLGMHIFQHLGAAAVGTVTASGYLFPPDGLITQDLLMSSIVDICNQALGAVGTRSSIASLTEPSKEAQTCLLFYDNVRQSILRAAHWNFARATTTGALLKAAPGTPENNVIDTVGVWKSAYPPPPWRYSYATPTDCLAVRQVKWQTGLNTSGGVPFMSGGMNYSPYQHATLPVRYNLASDKDAVGNSINVILSNAPSAIIEYTQDITNPTLWDALFGDCVIAALAAAMTPQLNGDPRRKKALLEEANENIVQARIANGNDELDIQNIPPEAIMARSGYGIDLQLGMAPYGPLLRL